MTAGSKAPNRELLLSQHTFPGPYTIKVFGPGAGTEFLEAVQDALAKTLCVGEVTLRERKSKQGNRSCITLEMQAQSVEEVEALYASLHGIPTLALIL